MQPAQGAVVVEVGVGVEVEVEMKVEVEVCSGASPGQGGISLPLTAETLAKWLLLQLLLETSTAASSRTPTAALSPASVRRHGSRFHLSWLDQEQQVLAISGGVQAMDRQTSSWTCSAPGC